jgi:hypothetical protein
VAWAERSSSAGPSGRAAKRGRGPAGVAKADAGLHHSQTRRESNNSPRRPPCHGSASINGGMGCDRLQSAISVWPCYQVWARACRWRKGERRSVIANQSKTLNCLSKERNGQRSYKKASVFSRGRARLARADNGQQTQNAGSHNSLAYPPNLNLFVTPPKAFSRFLETTPTTPPNNNKNCISFFLPWM